MAHILGHHQILPMLTYHGIHQLRISGCLDWRINRPLSLLITKWK
jgi:hypothetical protein